MSINGPGMGIDPNTYAQQYAQQKGISLSAAKEQLKSQYGDPQQMQQGVQQSGSIFNQQGGMQMPQGMPGMQPMGGMQMPQGGIGSMQFQNFTQQNMGMPQMGGMQGMQQGGMQMPQGMQGMQGMQQGGSVFNQQGSLQQQQQGTLENNPENFNKQLEQLGIPKEVIDQGQQAIEKYAKENNIQLPNPPDQTRGSKLNLLT